MSDNNKKSSLEEAKLNFEEIQRFAEEQAAKEAAKKLEEQVAETLKDIFEKKLNEDITINIDGAENVEIKKDGEVVASTDDVASMDASAGAEEMGLSSAEEMPADEEEFILSDEDDEIGVGGEDTMEETIQNQNMEEMNKMTMEQDAAAAPAPTNQAPVDANAAPAAPAVDANAAPVEEAPAMPELLSKLDTLINIMLQQQGGAPGTPDNAAAGTEQEFDVIDDEAAGTAPAGGATSAAPTGAAPVQEEEIEITDMDGEKNNNFIDEMEQMLEIVDEDEVPVDGTSVEETRSLGFTSKRTGDKALKMGKMKDEKGHHAPVTSINESEIKAQYESKLDELIKENSGLKNTVKELRSERKEFEDAFVELRTQFNEMQLFNGKLALVNKVLMNGGLTTEEKIKVCEQFDQAQTYEEASKLFKNIIKENNIKVVGDGKEKLKGSATNTAKPKSTTETLYESDEAKRLKRLAGIGNKTEEE